MVVYSFEFKEDIDLKWAKMLYLQSSCMSVIYVLINKCQLHNGVNSKLNFQKTWIKFFMYSKFSCAHHTNPKVTILVDFAEGRINNIAVADYLFN